MAAALTAILTVAGFVLGLRLGVEAVLRDAEKAGVLWRHGGKWKWLKGGGQ